jgi:hypothetical protein
LVNTLEEIFATNSFPASFEYDFSRSGELSYVPGIMTNRIPREQRRTRMLQRHKSERKKRHEGRSTEMEIIFNTIASYFM